MGATPWRFKSSRPHHFEMKASWVFRLAFLFHVQGSQSAAHGLSMQVACGLAKYNSYERT